LTTPNRQGGGAHARRLELIFNDFEVRVSGLVEACEKAYTTSKLSRAAV
jgi:hypothetical protein